MKETVLITGANSFIANHLVTLLQTRYNVKFLTRKPTKSNEYAWDTQQKTLDEAALDDVNYIVHLAGSKLNDGTPLTEERKKMIYESRIGAANLILETLNKRNQTIKSFVSASAIGYYGFSDNTLEIDENGAFGHGFAAELSRDWELAADQFKTENRAENVAKIRVALVLGNEGGIFPMYKNMVESNPKIASQNQDNYVPWNHVEDMAGIFAFAVEHQLDGVYNCVAPEPASQSDIFKTIANQLGISNEPISAFDGQHLVSKKIIEAGYQFKFPNIISAVSNLI